MHSVFAIILLCWPLMALSFPKKFTHMSLYQGEQTKEVFLIGDRHNLALEQSKEGQAAVKAIDMLIERLQHVFLIWEHGGKKNPRAQDVFLTTKGDYLFTRGKDFIASDRLRSVSWQLRRFLVNLNYNKSKAAGELSVADKRNEILAALRVHFGYDKGASNALHQIWQSCAVSLTKKQRLQVISFLDWFQKKVTFCGDSLQAWPLAAMETSLVIKTLQSVLVYGAADMEILLNTLCSKEQKNLVYAGKGHVDRVQKYLLKLGFQTEYELQTERFFQEEDYQVFRAKIEAKAPKTTFLATMSL